MQFKFYFETALQHALFSLGLHNALSAPISERGFEYDNGFYTIQLFDIRISMYKIRQRL